MDDSAPAIVEAAAVEETPEPARRPRPGRRGARGALACGVVGVLCLGFVLGPIALSVGQRLRLAMIADEDRSAASTIHAAIVLGRVGLAIHLTLAMAALPWILFVLPLMQGG